MAIILEAAYSTKLGLPNYSSHSYVVSIRAELSDLTQVEAESARLYHLLQQSVDHQIQQVGFLPDGNSYGMDNEPAATTSNANGNGAHHQTPPSSHHQPSDQWVCSDKQKEFILKLVQKHRLDQAVVEALAQEMFGLPVQTLNRLQASGLIDQLLARHVHQDGHGQTRPNGHGGKSSPRRPQPAQS